MHTLPYPDNTFDVVTLQFASRHLRIRRVAAEIRRVLKPGGRFYHSDMLRPGNPIVEKLYYTYLRFCLWFTGFLFRSGPAALNCKKYFIQALQMFYSAQELSDMMEDIGFRNVTAHDGVRRHARLSPRREAAAGLNRERALAALNGRLLREFSRRTTEELRAALPLRLALPALEPFLARERGQGSTQGRAGDTARGRGAGARSGA